MARDNHKEKEMRKDHGDYDVGYGKPPKATQFRKGQSGNPKGRPKGRKNTATVLNEVLAEKVTINENGRRRHVTKLEAAFKQVVNGAASGDAKCSRLLLQILPLANAQMDDPLSSMPSEEADLQTLQGFLDRLNALQPSPTGNDAGDKEAESQ